MGRPSLFRSVQLALERTQPPVKWLPVIKWQGFETDHRPPSRTEVKKSGAISPFPLHLHDSVLN